MYAASAPRQVSAAVAVATYRRTRTLKILCLPPGAGARVSWGEVDAKFLVHLRCPLPSPGVALPRVSAAV